MNPKCQFGGKTAFASENAAKKARVAMSRSKDTNDVRIYKCPNCFAFHFTSRKE